MATTKPTTTSFKQQCPSCETMVPIRDAALIGRKIDCPKCKYRFAVEKPAEEKSNGAAAPAKKPGAAAAAATNGKGKPGLKPGSKAEDKPQKEPGEKKEAGNSNMMMGVSLAAVAVILLGVGAYFLFFNKDSNEGGNKDPNKDRVVRDGAAPGGPQQPIPPGPGETDPNAPKQPPPPDTGAVSTVDITNLLPNDSQVVSLLNMKTAEVPEFPATLNALVFDTPGGFDQKAFERTYGFNLRSVSQIVVANNVKSNWSFAVLRTTAFLKQEDLEKKLGGTKATKSGFDYFVVRPDLDHLSIALFRNHKQGNLGVHLYDANTLVLADIAPLEKFLDNKRQPQNRTQPPPPPSTDQPKNEGPGTPMPPGGGAPMPPSGVGTPGGGAPMPPSGVGTPGGGAPMPPSGVGTPGGGKPMAGGGDAPAPGKPAADAPGAPMTGGAGALGTPMPPGGGAGALGTPMPPGGGAAAPGTPMPPGGGALGGPAGFPGAPGAGGPGFPDQGGASRPTGPSVSGSFLTVAPEMKRTLDAVEFQKRPISVAFDRAAYEALNGKTPSARGPFILRGITQMITMAADVKDLPFTWIFPAGCVALKTFTDDRLAMILAVDTASADAATFLEGKIRKEVGDYLTAVKDRTGMQFAMSGFTTGSGFGIGGGPFNPGGGMGGLSPPGFGVGGGVAPPGIGMAGGGGIAPPGFGMAGAGGIAPPGFGMGAGPPMPGKGNERQGALGAAGGQPPGVGMGGAGGIAPPGFGMAGAGGIAPPGFGMAGAGGIAPPGVGIMGGAPGGILGFQGGTPGTGGSSPMADPSDSKLEVRSLDRVVTISVEFIQADKQSARDFFSDIREGLAGYIVGVRNDAMMISHRSHVHDLAAALDRYVKDTGHFPRGTANRPNDGVLPYAPNKRISWMGEREFLKHLPGYEGMPSDSKSSWTEGTNRTAAVAAVPYFLASDEPPGAYPPSSWRFNVSGMDVPVAATHFVGIAGIGRDSPELPADAATQGCIGVFGYERETKLTDIKDGPENTIAVLQVPPRFKACWLAGGGGSVRYVAELDSIDPFVCTTYKGDPGTIAIMADGKVRFISRNMKPEIFRALCTIAGGEKIDKLDEIAPVIPVPKPAAVVSKDPARKPEEPTAPVEPVKPLPPPSLPAPPGTNTPEDAPKAPVEAPKPPTAGETAKPSVETAKPDGDLGLGDVKVP